VDGGYAHYGAAKAAIAHYIRYLAQDLGPFGITANCSAPGVIATGRIVATVIPGSVQGNRDRTELVARRLGTVDDCAKVVEFLATDWSDYVTGAVIPIDGGLVRGSVAGSPERLGDDPAARRPEAKAESATCVRLPRCRQSLDERGPGGFHRWDLPRRRVLSPAVG